jgi:hypothetical protein
VKSGVDSDDQGRHRQLHVAVIGRDDVLRRIKTNHAAVEACLAEEDHDAATRRANELVRSVACEIRLAVREVVGGSTLQSGHELVDRQIGAEVLAGSCASVSAWATCASGTASTR